MKLAASNHGFEGHLPEARTAFALEASGHMFMILSDGIYSDKILAVIRELICNAHDAHVAAGKPNVPFKLFMPTRLDPRFYVEDEGTGIEPALIGKIFWTYGSSTKREAEDQIGALGLGSKSPFAYTKSSFIVRNRYQGTEYEYLCFINEEGCPEGSMVDERPATKPDGVTVEFAVRPSDIYEFQNRFARIFKYWPYMPIMEGAQIAVNPPTKIIEGRDWFLEADSFAPSALAVQGNVTYPITSSSVQGLPKHLKVIADNSFVITFAMGELAFAVSRETLSYTERTCKNLIARLDEVRAELQQSFVKKVFIKGQTHLGFIQLFASTFKSFSKTFGDIGADEASEILLGKKSTDTVTYNGYNFVIGDMLTGLVKRTVDGHLPFGFYTYNPRREGGKRIMRSATNVVYECTAKSKLPKADYLSSYDIDPGDICINREWFVPTVSHRKVKGVVQYSTADKIIMAGSKLFKAETNVTFKLGSKVNFIVNDLKGPGEDRFKALSFDSGETTLLVQVDHGAIDPADAFTAVEQLVKKNGLTGATVQLISALPDNRAPAAKVPVDRTRLKLTQLTLEVLATKESASFSGVDFSYKKVANRGAALTVFTLADLQALPAVPYVIKRRANGVYFDHTGNYPGDITTSIVGSLGWMGMGIEFGMLDRLMDNGTLKVLVITESDYQTLKRKGLKLINIRAELVGNLKAAREADDFTEATRLVTRYNGAQLLTSIGAALGAELKAFAAAPGRSLLRSELSKLVDANANRDPRKFGLHKLFSSVVQHVDAVDHNSSKIDKALKEAYPLLKHMAIHTGSIADAMDYIELIDKK